MREADEVRTIIDATIREVRRHPRHLELRPMVIHTVNVPDTYELTNVAGGDVTHSDVPSYETTRSFQAGDVVDVLFTGGRPRILGKLTNH